MTINFNQLKTITGEQLVGKEINPEGILSEKIFGPVKTGYCGCGVHFLKSTNQDKCNKCDVENVPTTERSSRFAKIVSPLPFCTLVELTEIEKSIEGFKVWYTYPTKYKYYLHFDLDTKHYEITPIKKGCIIPLQLFGLYSLWLCGVILDLIWPKAPKLLNYFGFNLIVVPPNSRPSVITNSKLKFSHELDNEYNKVLVLINHTLLKTSAIDNARYLTLVICMLFPKLSDIDIDWSDVKSSVIDLTTTMNGYLPTDSDIIPYPELKTEDYAFIESRRDLFKFSTPETNEITMSLIKLMLGYFDKTGDHILTLTRSIKTINIDSFIETIVFPEMRPVLLYQKSIQKEISSTFNCMIRLLSGKEGMVRSQFLGKGIDFSARAVISANMFIKPYQVRLPKHMFIKLFFIEYLAYIYNFHSAEHQLTTVNLEKFISNSDNIKESIMVDKFIQYFFDERDFNILDRLVLINRQPTLWRYGIPAIQVDGISKGNTIELNPLMLDPLNGDFDGDTMAVYRTHDYTAKVELHENAYIVNTVKFDHNSHFLHKIKDETYFMLNSFTDCGDQELLDDNGDVVVLESITDIPLIYSNIKLANSKVKVNGYDNIVNIGTCLINIAAGFDHIVLKRDINREQISHEIFEDSKSNQEYFDRLHNLSIFINMFGHTIPNQTITIPFQECVDINTYSQKSNILNKLPVHPTIGFMIHKSESKKIMSGLTSDSSLYRFRQTKFGETQFARSLIGIGYLANHKNICSGVPITSSTFEGLDTDQFFRTSFGTRKGITDKQTVTPRSGYLARSLSMNLSPISLAEIDCGVEYGLEITVRDKSHAKSIVRRYYKYKQDEKEWLFINKTSDALELIGRRIVLRTPIFCHTDGLRVCKKCFGEYNKIPTKYVGVITGQYISERSTQLSMRSFHTSGSASYSLSSELEEFIINNLLDVDNHQYKFELLFDSPVPQHLVREMVVSFTDDDYTDHVVIKENGKVLEFLALKEFRNQDITGVLNDVTESLKVKHKVMFSDIESTYITQIKNMLSIGDIFSVFIELTMCNAYSDVDQTALIRYIIRDQNIIPTLITKRNIRTLHTLSSKTLSLLYLPNKNTILNMSDRTTNVGDTPSVFERIWNGTL